MDAVKAWLVESTLGLPHWGWALVVLLSVIEMFLGRSQDPRWRSVADSLRHALGLVLVPTLERLPAFGPALLALLRALGVLPAEARLRYSRRKKPAAS